MYTDHVFGLLTGAAFQERHATLYQVQNHHLSVYALLFSSKTRLSKLCYILTILKPTWVYRANTKMKEPVSIVKPQKSCRPRNLPF